jgi:hypothetical protein
MRLPWVVGVRVGGWFCLHGLTVNITVLGGPMMSTLSIKMVNRNKYALLLALLVIGCDSASDVLRNVADSVDSANDAPA